MTSFEQSRVGGACARISEPTVCVCVCVCVCVHVCLCVCVTEALDVL